MARTSKKQTTIAVAKLSAPDLPPNTCPYIDFVIETIENDFEAENDCDKMRKALIVETLEYIRTANDTLRISSKYWYDEFKKVA